MPPTAPTVEHSAELHSLSLVPVLKVLGEAPSARELQGWGGRVEEGYGVRWRGWGQAAQVTGDKRSERKQGHPRLCFDSPGKARDTRRCRACGLCCSMMNTGLELTEWLSLFTERRTGSLLPHKAKAVPRSGTRGSALQRSCLPFDQFQAKEGDSWCAEALHPQRAG